MEERDAIDSNEKCPTVMVKSGDGFVVINESDYDPKTMKLHVAKKADAADEADAK